MAIIQTKHLRKKYDKIIAVEDLNIEIEEGEVFGLLGPNGAGKTTIIKMLATLLEPSSGSAQVNGFDINSQSKKVRESIGIVFQEPSSDELLTAYENIKLYAMMYGIPDSEIQKGIRESLELVELTNRKDHLVRTFSGGMRRRLEIARSLIHKPKVLFLDEPTLGLDPAGREKMWDYISRLVEELGMTVLLTTHYMEEADSLADRIGIIDQGKIVVIDTPKALKDTLGGDVVTLTSQGLKIDEIEKLDYIKDLKQDKNQTILTVKDVNKNLQPLLNFVGNIDSVEVRTTTLNDVFLRFTGKRIDEKGKNSFFEKIIQESVRR
jgi:ABC-2 type transport system ATP-binding protein